METQLDFNNSEAKWQLVVFTKCSEDSSAVVAHTYGQYLEVWGSRSGTSLKPIWAVWDTPPPLCP